MPKRFTFAIISHPDAGKTTLTEKFLKCGGAINLAGTVKSRKSSKYATSDWLELEKQRGISVTTSVMQFEYGHRIINLLDTPGHADFSEDTYRTLTAVDCALMVIDAVKGVEDRTITLMEICRQRNTPIITFINKLDRAAKDPLDLICEIEEVLQIQCVPRYWPIGSGSEFKGIYDLTSERHVPYNDSDEIDHKHINEVKEILDLDLELDDFYKANTTPVFFGSALKDFGIDELLDFISKYGPEPSEKSCIERVLHPTEAKFSGFVFKIQANMDPKHRDRIAFMRVCSGEFTENKSYYHVRSKKSYKINKALTFVAQSRKNVSSALPGDIIGIMSNGKIQVGDSFTEGESLSFTGIPNFAPSIFQSVRPMDPMKAPQLLKGLIELSQEGAIQLYRPLLGNRLVLGAVGALQFDVIKHRLDFEYKVDCLFEACSITAVRWVIAENLTSFIDKNKSYLAIDPFDNYVYLAPNSANLSIAMEKYPEVKFTDSIEISC